MTVHIAALTSDVDHQLAGDKSSMRDSWQSVTRSAILVCRCLKHVDMVSHEFAYDPPPPLPPQGCRNQRPQQ